MTNWLEDVEKDNNFFYNANGYFHTRYGSSTIWTPSAIKMLFHGHEIRVFGTRILELDYPSSWEDGDEPFSKRENRCGESFSVKLYQDNDGDWDYWLSSDFDSDIETGVVVGGFHCVHPISIVPQGACCKMPYRVEPDYVMGNVFPNSVWSLNFRPTCHPAYALFYLEESNEWMAIYDNVQESQLTGVKIDLFNPDDSYFKRGGSLMNLDSYKALVNSSVETYHITKIKSMSERAEKIREKIIEKIIEKEDNENRCIAELIDKYHEPTSLLERMQLRVKKSVEEKERRRQKLKTTISDQELFDRIYKKYKSAWKKLAKL